MRVHTYTYLKLTFPLGEVAHYQRKQRQMALCELEASLVYKAKGQDGQGQKPCLEQPESKIVKYLFKMCLTAGMVVHTFIP